MTIKDNVIKILGGLPCGVELVAAAKTRSPAEIREAVDAGIRIIGENYVQEAEKTYNSTDGRVRWHLIGHLQRNKVRKAVRIFDLIETIDSIDLAAQVNQECHRIGKKMPVLVEINTAREEHKSGIMPEDTEKFVRELSCLTHISVLGLMTIGPAVADPEQLRPYFVVMKQLFETIKLLNIPCVEMQYLSMGMTDSYQVAIQEGANMVRIGTGIFGKRKIPAQEVHLGQEDITFIQREPLNKENTLITGSDGIISCGESWKTLSN